MSEAIHAPCPKCGKVMNGSRFCIGYGGSCDYVATDIEADLIRRLTVAERQRDELLAALQGLRSLTMYDDNEDFENDWNAKVLAADRAIASIASTEREKGGQQR